MQEEQSKLVDHYYLLIPYQIYKRGFYPLGTSTIVTDKWNSLVCEIENLWRRMGCPVYVPHMSRICPAYVPHMPRICPAYVPHL